MGEERQTGEAEGRLRMLGLANPGLGAGAARCNSAVELAIVEWLIFLQIWHA